MSSGDQAGAEVFFPFGFNVSDPDAAKFFQKPEPKSDSRRCSDFSVDFILSSKCTSDSSTQMSPTTTNATIENENNMALAHLSALVLANGNYFDTFSPAKLSPEITQNNFNFEHLRKTMETPIFRKQRTVYAHYQLMELEKAFNQQQYMVGSDRQRLAHKLGITETQVRIWYQNRRSKWRKDMRDHHHLRC